MSNAWRWLESTCRLQQEVYGVDYGSISGEKLADHMLMNAFALADELHEAMAECQWKDWAANRGQVNRDLMLGELIDLAHFLANMVTALDVTDEEWERRYQEKQQRNRDRQARPSGYTSRQAKCPRCRRELDKLGAVAFVPAVAEISGYSSGRLACAVCDAELAAVYEDGSVLWDSRLPGNGEGNTVPLAVAVIPHEAEKHDPGIPGTHKVR